MSMSRTEALNFNERMGPKDYANLVAAYAQHTTGTSSFAKDLFEGLAAFLSRDLDLTKLSKVDVIIHTISNSSNGESRGNVVTISDIDKLQDTLSARDNASVNDSTIVFMRGHQPPGCLTRIGANFKIDPYFFLRHLEYLWSLRPLKFSSPCLLSASTRILRLKLFTLGQREEKGGRSSNAQLEILRAKSQSSMIDYQRNVTHEYMLNPGNSIVRTFNVHSARYLSVEQEVTVTVQAKDSGWSVLVWTDAGQHLGNGPEGPWHPERHGTTPQLFIPTIQHIHKENMKLLSGPKSSVPDFSEGPFAQSALTLAYDYGLTLDPALVLADSFYALTELFQTSANSICQLLNLLDTVIDGSTGYNQSRSQDYSLGNLSYHQDILKRLGVRLRENISVLESRQSTPWPRSYGSRGENARQSKAKAEATAELLLTDFRNLLSRIERLAVQCQDGMSACMNSAAIEESQCAIGQAGKMKLLTWLAFIYIPLSFTNSFFGMNLGLFGSGTMHLWVWFAVSIPLVPLSYLILAWLSGGISRRLVKKKYVPTRDESYQVGRYI